MLLLTIFFALSLFLVLILKLVSVLISEYSLLNREELSSYECGFEHHNLSRVPFSLRYFFLTLVFLLFDLEVILMLFVAYFRFIRYFFFRVFILFLFLLILFIGLIYEWQDGTLEWIV